MPTRIPVILLLSIVLLPVQAAEPPADDARLEQPSESAAELPAELGFLSGCWRGEIGADGSRVVERYGDIDGATLLGSLKTIRGNETVFFEFLRIHRDEDAVLLTPQPNGQPAKVSFTLVELEPDKASFDNPDHDFPRRITYRLLANGQLLTRVAGVIGERTVVEEYRSLPVPCRQL